MIETKLPACIFRGEVAKEDAEFGCLCPEREEGTATLTECNECPLRMAQQFEREIPHRGILQTAKDVVVGGYQTAKVYAGVDSPGEIVIQQRYDACNACEHNIAGQCNLCSCYIATKIRLRGQACPDHRWEAVNG
jgi:hypothetical protein